MERQHIALTEAQIIAAEKGELQLETRDGRKVVQFVWFREPYDQSDRFVIIVVDETGRRHGCYKDGHCAGGCNEYDLFVSEPAAIEPAKPEPNPIYEVGEIIEYDTPSGWVDVEYREDRNGQVCVFSNGMYKSIPINNLRKKQTEKTVTLNEKVMTVKEAFKYLTNLNQ